MIFTNILKYTPIMTSTQQKYCQLVNARFCEFLSLSSARGLEVSQW